MAREVVSSEESRCGRVVLPGFTGRVGFGKRMGDGGALGVGEAFDERVAGARPYANPGRHTPADPSM